MNDWLADKNPLALAFVVAEVFVVPVAECVGSRLKGLCKRLKRLHDRNSA